MRKAAIRVARSSMVGSVQIFKHARTKHFNPISGPAPFPYQLVDAAINLPRDLLGDHSANQRLDPDDGSSVSLDESGRSRGYFPRLGCVLDYGSVLWVPCECLSRKSWPRKQPGFFFSCRLAMCPMTDSRSGI